MNEQRLTTGDLINIDSKEWHSKAPDIGINIEDWNNEIEYNKFDIPNTALNLYDLGFNVVPIFYGMKIPIGKWKPLQTTRLPRNAMEIFSRKKLNVGVITGRHSRNLFVIDCDSKEASENMLEKINKLNLDQWIVSSSRGIHIWLLSEDGVVKYLSLDNIQVFGNNKIVLTPPSLHPSGIIYTWIKRDGELPPLVNAEKMREIFPRFRVYGGNTGLPFTAKQVLIDKNITGYLSNSEAEYAAVLSLKRKGFDDDSIIELFNEYQPKHYASKGRNAESWLEQYMISKAGGVIHIKNYSNLIDSAIHWAKDQPWPGKKGSTDRLVFLACCERAKKENPYKFRASQRELSELSGISRKTVTVSLKRLIDAGYIIQIKSNEIGLHYSLSKEVRNYSTNKLCIFNGVNLYPYRNHDAWHPYALGRTGLEVYEALLRESNIEEGLTTEKLEEITGKHNRTIKRALIKLKENNLVKNNNVSWLAETVDADVLDKIAIEYGVLGKTDERKETHRKERANYALSQLISRI